MALSSLLVALCFILCLICPQFLWDIIYLVMKKKIYCEKGSIAGVNYVSPEVEVIDVVVEKGFASSPSLEDLEEENDPIGW